MGDFTGSLIKILIFLPLVLILAYISLKVGNSQMMKAGNGKLIRIIERVPVSGKAYLCIAIINEKPYVISSTEERLEILLELPPEALESMRNGETGFKEALALNFNHLLKRKDRT